MKGIILMTLLTAAVFATRTNTLIDFKNYNPVVSEPFTFEDVSLNKVTIALGSSSDTLPNRQDSQIKAVTNKTGDQLLGVKMKVNDGQGNTYGQILFPYRWNIISKETGFLKNIGQLKRIYMTVHSSFQEAKIGIIVNNKTIELGELTFVGKRILMYENSNYDFNVIYTNDVFKDNFLVLNGFYIQKFNQSFSGRIITYIEKVDVEYDLAYDFSNSVDNKVWQIGVAEFDKQFVIETNKLTYNRDIEAFNKIK